MFLRLENRNQMVDVNFQSQPHILKYLVRPNPFLVFSKPTPAGASLIISCLIRFSFEIEKTQDRTSVAICRNYPYLSRSIKERREGRLGNEGQLTEGCLFPSEGGSYVHALRGGVGMKRVMGNPSGEGKITKGMHFAKQATEINTRHFRVGEF